MLVAQATVIVLKWPNSCATLASWKRFASVKKDSLIGSLLRISSEGVFKYKLIRDRSFFKAYYLFNRYCFLAFGYEERVVADRETCQKLLVRLKLEGWAVGKTKVFLRYYHVEYLSKIYDQQIRRIVLIQSCIRRWLAKIRLTRVKFTAPKNGTIFLNIQSRIFPYSNYFR